MYSIIEVRAARPSPTRFVDDYPQVVKTLSLQNIYDQHPSRSNAKGCRIAQGSLKTPANDADDLPGGAGTIGSGPRGPQINVPSGTPNYIEWDLTGYELIVGQSTTVSFTDSIIKPAADQLLMWCSAGTIVLAIDWCTVDATVRNLNFGSLYMNNSPTQVDTTVTNSHWIDDPNVCFLRAGTCVGSDVITDNYFGRLNQGGAVGDHCEYHHDLTTAAGTRSITVQRNFFDSRNRNAGAADTITGYLRPENTGGTVDWLAEDNIFIGFGDPSTVNFTAAWAFQLAGLGSYEFNRNAIQNHDHPTTGYFTVSSGTLTGSGNRRWGADGSLDTLIVEGGVN